MVHLNVAWFGLVVGIATTGAWAASGPGIEVYVADLNLRTAIEKALGIQPGYAIGRADMERLRVVDVSGSAYDVLELTGLEFAVNLERLDLRGNRVGDLGPLEGLQRLNRIELDGNHVTDISPLAANEGIGLGDQVFLGGNPLDPASIGELIPELESRGVFVAYRDDHGNGMRTATSLVLGRTSEGGIGSASDADYFGFEVSSAADVAIFTTGGDTHGDLLTGTGQSLASDSASGAFDNFLMRQHLQPGRYYVRVTGARGTYTLHAVEGAPVRFADGGLQALVATALGDAARDGISTSDMATLTGMLDASGRGIRQLGGLEFAVNLTGLRLSRNPLESLTPLSSLVSLAHLDLERVTVTDIAPLVANPGLGAGDTLFLGGNTLSEDAVGSGIPALERRGVFVAYTDDHGDDLDAATPLILGDTVPASIYPTTDRDVFRFQLATATDVVIYATGDADTVGVLYDVQGRVLGVYRAGEPQSARIARALDAGDYYLQVRAASATVRGPYFLHAHKDPNAGILPDSNLRAAVAGMLNRPLEAPITAVDLAAMTSLEATGAGIANLTGLELAVNLTHVDLGGNGVADIEPLSHLVALKELRLADNGISDLGPLLMNAGLGEGDLVFLQGNPLSLAANEQVADLVAKGVSVVFADEHANSPAEATALALGHSLAASIHSELDQDYFRVTVPEESASLAVFTTGELDLIGTLSADRGAQLAVDDDGGSARNFLLRSGLAAGDYFIKVEGDADETGAYVVHAVVDEYVHIADRRLRARIARATVGSGGEIRTGDLASLEVLDVANSRTSNLTGLDAAVNLRHLTLRHNLIDRLEPLSGLTRLAELDLEGNDVSDLGALVANAGLGSGDKVILAGNPLSPAAEDAQLPALEERGVFMGYLDDHGDRLRDATGLAPGGSAVGTLSSLGDHDVFRLELSEDTDVAIFTTGPTDTAGRLSDAGSRSLVADTDSGTGGNFIVRRNLSAGVYFVTVSGSGGFDGVGPYVLHAAVAPTAPPANVLVLRDGSSLVVTWDPVPTDHAGGKITRYRVVATPSDGGEPIGCTADPDANGCTLVGLIDGVEYAVAVQAVNAVGFGPAGGAALPGPIADDVPLTSFWRGWRLSLAAPPTENDTVAD